jgi:HEAT repeat protein
VLARLERTRQAEPALGAMNTTVRLRQQVAIEVLTKTLGDYDRDLRFAAAEALGRIGDARLSPSLLPVLKDVDAWVRGAAADALDKMGWKPSK